MIPELEQSTWPDRFDAVRMPRGNLVVAMPQRWVEAAVPSMEEAEALAEALNRWLAAKPEPGLVPAALNFNVHGAEARLTGILDAGLGPELHAERLQRGRAVLR